MNRKQQGVDHKKHNMEMKMEVTALSTNANHINGEINTTPYYAPQLTPFEIGTDICSQIHFTL